MFWRHGTQHSSIAATRRAHSREVARIEPEGAGDDVDAGGVQGERQLDARLGPAGRAVAERAEGEDSQFRDPP
jgi:hypothetical protein